MNAIGETAVQPVLVGFDTEEVIAHLCQVAVSPFAFKGHLSQDNGRWNAILPLLLHCCYSIVLNKLSRRKQVVFLYSEGFDSPGFRFSYIQKQIVGVFLLSFQPATDMKMGTSTSSGGSANANRISCQEFLLGCYPNL